MEDKVKHGKCGTCKYYLPNGHEPEDMGVCGYPETSLDEIDDVLTETFAVGPDFILSQCDQYERREKDEQRNYKEND